MWNSRRAFMRQLGIAVAASAFAPAVGRAASQSTSDRAASVFASLQRKARAQLKSAPLGAAPALPAALRAMAYDQYRALRFRPERSVWRERQGFFEAQLFHRGYGYLRPVEITVHDDRGASKLAYDPGRFAFPAGMDTTRLGDLGYAGLRVHAPFIRPEYADEVLVFLGASYFRSLGRGQAYGLSGRCLAIDSGLSKPEEFPEIVALHLITPDRQERSLHVLAEVRSARVEGAFHFLLTPGEATTLDVRAALFLRAPVDMLGLAPLTSMHLFGEDATGRFDDFRPEVHDSDALLLLSASGERIVRPLRNPPRTCVSSFRLDNPAGFGLLQRDRNAASYQDFEARYHARPSAWVQPTTGWGAGAVRLLEIATRLETDDNIGAFFVPDHASETLSYGYRVSFGPSFPPQATGARVVGLRHGTPGAGVVPVTDGSRLFVVDWSGDGLQGAQNLQAKIDCQGGTVSDIRTEKNPNDGGWRVSFRVKPSSADVELRAFLHQGSSALSETLAYLWQPGERRSQ